ncbi:MAG: UDP-N-acetylglucosamine 2-epimerase (non-hydrolyzing) [Methanosarcinales archaeon]|nr:UDP-N-acetylglucosamine 2-epimerase (non-hydrolyzing) [Methanosarcinales archaeon]
MKIASVVGARPNFIKLAPVSRELRKSHEEIIIHTGQHYNYELDRIFFDELGMPEPDYHLNVGSSSHGRQTGEMLKGIEETLIQEKPDGVIVFGDTNSTLAGALAAVKMHIKIAHVEAGLRSYDMSIPEEVNRVLVDHCSNLLFCPTRTAIENLRAERMLGEICLSGDVMVDIQNECLKIAESRSTVLQELGIKSKDYYLATVHRPWNTDDPLTLKGIAEAFQDLGNVVFPCHPRTEKYLKQYGLYDELSSKVKLIKAVGYLQMLVLEKNARKIITDSGGVQKEAYLLGVPCLTLRKSAVIEWPETVQDGWNLLVGSRREDIVKAAKEFEPIGKQRQVFGRGDASRRIIEGIESFASDPSRLEKAI